jgi:hypothetical protein
MKEQCLLNIVVSPAIQDSMTDWLLTRSKLPGFTSMRAYGHGSSSRGMTLAEQVAGNRDQVLFMAHLSIEEAKELIKELGDEFAGSGLHYWLSPVSDAGRIA